MKPRVLVHSVAAALLSGCLHGIAAERPPIDCSIARADTWLQRCDVVRRASEFGTQCISPAQFSGHTCLVLDSDATFCESAEDFPLTVFLDRDDTTLDCAGGSIDHGWPLNDVMAGTDPEPSPLTRQGRRFPGIHAPSDRSVNNVTIRQCRIARTGHMGIDLSRFFGGQLDADTLPQGHTDIRIEDVSIEDTISGIFVGAYSHDITMDRLYVDGTQRIAIYSEAGSHGIRLRDSVIANNLSREALALDSTYDSEVSDTLFVNNREGAINLYRNCGELKGIVCPVERSTPPNDNRLHGNTFVNNGVAGLQIASRQGRRHAQGWCQSLDGQAGQFEDTADNNVVENNTFVCDSGTALRVLDGPNRIAGNRIVARSQCVPLEISPGGLGRDAGTLLDGIVVDGNQIQSERLPRLRHLPPGVTYRP